MIRKKWNRQARKNPHSEPRSEEEILTDPNIYIISRVRALKRRKKHCGYTLIPATRYGFFDKSVKFNK